MAWVPGGGFLMGSQDFYPEERPVRRVEVDGFWMDDHPVTVAEFRRFTAATGYVTVAERPLDPAQYPGGQVQHSCCTPRNPRVTSAEASLVPGEPGAHIPRRVTKGGSHLCAPNYCLRYRPAARQPQAIDTATCHLGFRCILRAASGP